MDECNVTLHPAPAPPCDWANDGVTDPNVWAMRRHGGKVYALARTFAAVFGEAAVPARVRPVFAEWSIFPQHYNATMRWLSATYGDASKYVYAIGTTGYFGGNNKAPNMTLDAVFAEFANSTATQAAPRAAFAALAAELGVKVVAYEAGPGWGVGSMNNLGAFIVAQRLAPMRALTAGDVAAWAAAGGAADAYNHFSLSGKPARFGMWGHAENFFNQSTPKWCAVVDTTGAALTPETAACAGW